MSHLPAASSPGHEQFIVPWQAGHESQQLLVEEGHIAGDRKSKGSVDIAKASVQPSQGAAPSNSVGNHASRKGDILEAAGAIGHDDNIIADGPKSLNNRQDQRLAVVQSETRLVFAQAAASSPGQHNP